MKGKLSTALCVMLCALLLILALAVGAVRGWAQEREEAARDADYALLVSAEERMADFAMDAANLAVVAQRHLPKGHPDVQALQDAFTAYKRLSDQGVEAAMPVLREAAEAAARLSVSLPQLESVRQSARDTAYVSTLCAALASAPDVTSATQSHYEQFNQRMEASFTGRLAMLLGVKPLGQEAAE